jgi:hypothetical protein
MHNVVMFAWNRSLPGREQLSGQHFQDFVAYLQAQKAQGTIESFDPVLLEPHGLGPHGFFLIRGAPERLQTLTASPDWVEHQVRAMMHLDGPAVMRGVTGAAVGERMALWAKAIPKAQGA